jgi:hypothetical protein
MGKMVYNSGRFRPEAFLALLGGSIRLATLPEPPKTTPDIVNKNFE